jgi:DNA-binding NarL/FixJ family response regulator
MRASVLVLDDDDFTRMTLASTLTLHGVEVVKECKTASEAISAAQEKRPTCALLDLDLGRGPTGLDVSRVLRAHNPSIGIVFLTSYRDPRLIASPGQEPPAGSQYLVKKSVATPAVLLAAIERSLVARKADKLFPDTASSFSRLTSSQVATLRLLAEGNSNQEIARVRSVTEKSVEQQIARIAKKLGIGRDLDHNIRVKIARAYFEQTGS